MLNLFAKNKRPLLTKKRKRGLIIFGCIVVALGVIGYAGGLMEQSRLERDNVSIVVSEIDDDIKLDYHTTKREISAKISGISTFAEVKVAGDRVSVYNSKDTSGFIKYKIENIKEGDSDVNISIVDGKRRGDKTIKIHRQTKDDYDKQELEKTLSKTEE